MWKVGACVLLTFLSVHGNGYYGNDESGAAQAQPQSASSVSNSQVATYPEYDSPAPPGKEQDFWWLKQNPFQKPPNHPGLEKADQGNPPNPSPYGNQQQPAFNSRPRPQQPAQPAVPAYGGQAQYNSGAFSQQASRPSPNPYNARAPQPNQPYAKPGVPAASPECLLRNKADCHSAEPATLGSTDQGNVNYQQRQPAPGYPSDDDNSQYQINIPGPQKVSRLPNNVLDQQQPVQLQLGQKPGGSEQKPFNDGSYQPNNQQRPYQNPGAQSGRQPPYSSFSASGQSSQTVNSGFSLPSLNSYQVEPVNPPPQNDYSNKVAYSPPTRPYQPPVRQTQNQAQGSQPLVPSTGAVNNNYEEQPPYPGCPAAMLCVPESYCNSKGVSEGKPISLSPAEKLYRVALMACSAPTTGEVGVCCRDPDYKDPWPNMGGNGGHEHQHGGFDDGQYHPPATPQVQPYAQPSQSQSSQSGVPLNPVRQQAQSYTGNQNQGIQTSASFDAPHLFQCQPEEECVEDFKCHQGFISTDFTSTAASISVTNKCKADTENLSFVCCKRSPAPSVTPEQSSSTLPSNRYEFTDTTTVHYTKNYFLHNTLAPSLVTGRGFPYVQRATPNLRFSNPYRGNQPIYLITTSTPATSTQSYDSVSTTAATTSTLQPDFKNPYHASDEIEGEDSAERIPDQEPTPLKLVLWKGDGPFVESEHATVPEQNSTQIETGNQTFSENSNVAQSENQTISQQNSNIAQIENQTYSEPSSTQESPKSSTEQGTTETGSTEEPKGVTDSTNPEDTTDQNSTYFYNPNPWSYDGEYDPPEPIQVPHQFYQLPPLPDTLFTEDNSTSIVPEAAEAQQKPVFLTRSGFPGMKNFVEECPNNMKCLRESYCQEINPNEGSADQFDIRLSFRKTTPYALKCKQTNLPVDGVCCFLREDYMSQVTTQPLSIEIEPTVPLLPEEVCGVRHKKRNPVHETEYTEFGEFPWQALIVAGDRQCSGAIISDRVIATTASCLHNLTDTEIKIRVGEWDQKNEIEAKPHQDLTVAVVIRQPRYIHSNLSYNIALIYTTEKIAFNYHIGRVCLPQPVTNFEGKTCVATGWGSARRSFRGSDRSNERYLLQAELKTLDTLECVQRLQKTSLGTEFKLPRTTLCAGGESKRDTCNGDEGSPLFCENSITGEYVLAGFLMGTSWGVNCGKPDVPGVFVNLPTLIEWMYNFIRQDPAVVISSQLRFQKNKMSN